MPRWEKKKEPIIQLIEETPEAVKYPIYYCNRGQYVFQLPVYEKDENDEIVKVNGRAKKAYAFDNEGNNRRELKQDFKFDRLPVIDPKTGKPDAKLLIGIFVISPEFPLRWERRDELVSYLELSRKNAHTHVVSESDYKKSRNPEAFIKEQEISSLKMTIEQLRLENERIKDKSKDSGVTIE
jgi:hypothetical protein